MATSSRHFGRIRNLNRRIVALLILLVPLVGIVAGSSYYSMVLQSSMTAESPPVILQDGTVGTSTIYTNSTSAKVSVSGYGYDFVENNDTDVDLSGSIGTHSNFTAQKYGPDLINDTLTEEGASGTFTLELWVDGFDNTRVEWDEIGSTPYLSSINYPTDYITTSADAVEERFDFANTSATGTINDVEICVYTRQDPADDGNIEMFMINSTEVEKIATFTPSDSAWTWSNFSCLSTLSTWTEINDAKLRLSADRVEEADIQYADAALLFVNYTISTSYELDLEVQWASVDFDETYEELCIKTGAFSGSEDIRVYAWNVSSSDWHFLYNLTASSWNNVSVADWLNNVNFTVRFLGGTESSDTIEDSWNIDATLLHVWTETDYVYDYVLRVNNTDTDSSWEIRLKTYGDSNRNRLQNCTIYFRNSTNNNSTQISIENGLYEQYEGSWYDLSSLETIYIAMTAQANSTATSLVRTYLEILVPSTTTYAQYIITFEIT